MSIWQTILNVLTVVLWILGIGLVILICYLLGKISKYGGNLIDIVLDFICKPFESIFKFFGRIFNKFGFKFSFGVFDTFALRHPNLGTGRSLLTVSLALVFSVIMLFYFFFTKGFEEIILDLLKMYPFFAFIEIKDSDSSFAIITLISSGISALLIKQFYNLCVGDYFCEGSFIRRIISILYYIITVITACFIGLLSSNILDWLADKGISLFITFKDVLFGSHQHDSLALFKIMFSFSALLIISYLGIVLILATLREYLDIICYGVKYILVLLAIFAVAENGFKIDLNPFSTAIIISFICLFVISDYLRVNAKEES